MDDILTIGSYYRTVGGYAAYLMGTVPIGYNTPYPLRGFLRNKTGGWVACSWTDEGKVKLQALPSPFYNKTNSDCFDLTPNEIELTNLPETSSLDELLQDVKQDHKKLALLNEFVVKLKDL